MAGLSKLKNEHDAFGHAVWDHAHGTNAFEIIERSDGPLAISGGPAQYLAPPKFWSPLAIAVAKERGLSNAQVLSIDELSTDIERAK